MGFHKWSLGDKVVMIWALTIASVAVIFIIVSLSNLLFENSSLIASWVQAIGSILAIIAAWLIATTQQRTSREQELRLAALDAAAMYVEFNSLLGFLRTVEGTALYMLQNPGSTFQSTVTVFISRVDEISLRPLSAQDKIVPVGIAYLALVAEIHQDIIKSKNEANVLLVKFGVSHGLAFDQIRSMQSDFNKIIFKCESAKNHLKKFAESQGISLTTV